MISLDFELFIFIFLSIGLISIISLWVYYDFRERSLYSDKREVHAFHCVKCGKVYSVPGVKTSAECPECSFRNGRLGFS